MTTFCWGDNIIPRWQHYTEVTTLYRGDNIIPRWQHYTEVTTLYRGDNIIPRWQHYTEVTTLYRGDNIIPRWQHYTEVTTLYRGDNIIPRWQHYTEVTTLYRGDNIIPRWQTLYRGDNIIPRWQHYTEVTTLYRGENIIPLKNFAQWKFSLMEWKNVRNRRFQTGDRRLEATRGWDILEVLCEKWEWIFWGRPIGTIPHSPKNWVIWDLGHFFVSIIRPIFNRWSYSKTHSNQEDFIIQTNNFM